MILLIKMLTNLKELKEQMLIVLVGAGAKRAATSSNTATHLVFGFVVVVFADFLLHRAVDQRHLHHLQCNFTLLLGELRVFQDFIILGHIGRCFIGVNTDS